MKNCMLIENNSNNNNNKKRKKQKAKKGAWKFDKSWVLI